MLYCWAALRAQELCHLCMCVCMRVYTYMCMRVDTCIHRGVKGDSFALLLVALRAMYACVYTHAYIGDESRSLALLLVALRTTGDKGL